MWHTCFYQICLSLKDTKAKTVLFGFIEIVTESKRKPNKLQIDQGK